MIAARLEGESCNDRRKIAAGNTRRNLNEKEQDQVPWVTSGRIESRRVQRREPRAVADDEGEDEVFGNILEAYLTLQQPERAHEHEVNGQKNDLKSSNGKPQLRSCSGGLRRRKGCLH
jgi:hypothetical protein